MYKQQNMAGFPCFKLISDHIVPESNKMYFSIYAILSDLIFHALDDFHFIEYNYRQGFILQQNIQNYLYVRVVENQSTFPLVLSLGTRSLITFQ